MGAAHGSGAEIIEPHGNAHVLAGGAHVARRIEADPAEAGDVSFGPGVAHLVAHPVARHLVRHLTSHLARLVSRLRRKSAVTLAEIAGDIARRRPERARDRDENVGKGLGYAAST